MKISAYPSYPTKQNKPMPFHTTRRRTLDPFSLTNRPFSSTHTHKKCCNATVANSFRIATHCTSRSYETKRGGWLHSQTTSCIWLRVYVVNILNAYS
mmetsp:Transcript_50533/g.60799  ORF Transcript_50533/g.60799 Transcript_50533/m.60799 type:complete len:97 (+) Transcript_50533:344-634(+)